MSEAAHRHDRFFRSYFERPEVLGQLLEFALPPEVGKALDTSSLRLESRTYVDKDHREYFADLSASVASRGGPVRVYVLFEHKSWSDAGTLLQLLRYMVQVWARELKAGGGGGTGVHGKSLTPVIPVVVYHGEGAAPRMSFQDLFALSEDQQSVPLSRYIPAFEAAMVDVAHMPAQRLNEMPPSLSAGLWTLRVARGTIEDFLEVSNRLGKRWGNVLLQDPGFELLFTYMLQGSGLSLEALEEKVSKAIESSLVEEAVVTTYNQLIQKGRKEGLQEGEERGFRKGHAEASHESAVVFAGKLLDKGMPIEEVAELTELSIEEVQAIAEKRSAE